MTSVVAFFVRLSRGEPLPNRRIREFPAAAE